MNADYIFNVFVQESFDISAEVMNEHEGRWLVIIEFILMGDSIETFRVICAFGAEIIDLISPWMLLPEELLNIIHMITVEAFHTHRRESHGDDSWRDIAQVEIVATLLISILFQADSSSSKVPGLVRLQIIIT